MQSALLRTMVEGHKAWGPVVRKNNEREAAHGSLAMMGGFDMTGL